MLFYLLRASICMALFYDFYKLFFSRTTFHAANRLLLALMLLFTAWLPACRYNLLPHPSQSEIIWVLQPIPGVAVETPLAPQAGVEIPWVLVLTLVYGVGLLFFLWRYAHGLLQIRGIISKSERRPLPGGFDLCISDRDIPPFSWMKHIVISRTDWSSENGAVVNHETAHALRKHSWDKMSFDFFACIFWFNPFAWLFRREIQSIHEFQADEYVITHGADATQYQLLLIRKSAGKQVFALANNFLQRDLQKRIRMMTKRKTNPMVRMAYAAIFPVILSGIAVLSIPELNAKEKSKTENFEILPSAQTQRAAFSSDRDPLAVSSKSSFTGDTLKLKRGNNVKFIAKGHVADGAENTEREGITVVGYPKNDSLSNPKTIVVTGYKSNGKSPIYIRGFDKGLTPLFIVDGKEISREEMDKISSGDIESVSVLKDKSAVEQYGEKGKNGVLIIEKKKH